MLMESLLANYGVRRPTGKRDLISNPKHPSRYPAGLDGCLGKYAVTVELWTGIVHVARSEVAAGHFESQSRCSPTSYRCL